MSDSDTANADKGKKASSWNRDILVTAAILLVLVIGVGLFPPPWLQWSSDSDHGRSTESFINLRRIGIALVTYSTARRDGMFPPAQVADEEGRPMHSWRVLILRELEYEDLYDAYDFDKPWDDPENLKLVERMPSIYASPFNRDQRKLGLTPYQAVSATGTVLGTTQALTLGKLARSNSQRIMVVADFDDPVPWTKPEDISPAEIAARLEQFKRKPPSQFHVLMSDGAVRRIDKEITVDELGKMF